MARRLIAVAAMSTAMLVGGAGSASADPLITVGCDADDHHVTVEVLNTEVASVCYD